MSERIIKIPTKHIYNKENQKVIDNIIERIEVEAVEVVPDNEYETPVYNKDYYEYDEVVENEKASYEDASAFNQGASSIRNVRGACGIKYKLYYVSTPDIFIQKHQNNKFITKIYSEKNDRGKDEIKIGLRFSQTKYKGSCAYQPNANFFDFNNQSLEEVKEEKSNVIYGFEDYTDGRDVSNEVSLLSVSTPKTVESIHSIIEDNNKLTITSSLFVDSNFNWTPNKIELVNLEGFDLIQNEFIVTDEVLDDKECYKISSNKILVSVDVSFASCLIENTQEFSNISSFAKAVATKISQKLETLSITVYGNTIGIDLKDKTVYINGDTAKKANRVERNELMQTSNYYLSNGVKMPSIELLYESTNTLYKKGKETATIRCSISDYFDYSTNEKVISTDGTTNKMAFSLYDKVVPMVRNGHGIDVPMSLTKAGNAKSFSVLGTKIFYDGAVWQELYLQESKDDSPISKPTISVDGDILKILSLDDRVSSFEIYIDDALNTTVQYLGEETTVDLSKLNLSSQVHKIAVKAKAIGYDDSELSDAKYYGAGPKQLEKPTLSLDGDILTITRTDPRTIYYTIYVGHLPNNHITAEGVWTTFDLSTLGLSAGIHTITATAGSPYYTSSPESLAKYYQVQPEPEVPIPDGVDNVFNNELKTELLISGGWCFADTPDIEWLNRVLRIGTNVTEFTVLASETGDFENLEDWVRTTLIFTDSAIVIDDTAYTTFGDGSMRFIWFDPEQLISYNLANWIVGNTLVMGNDTSLMSTRARTTFPKGSIKHI